MLKFKAKFALNEYGYEADTPRIRIRIRIWNELLLDKLVMWTLKYKYYSNCCIGTSPYRKKLFVENLIEELIICHNDQFLFFWLNGKINFDRAIL